MVSFVVGTGGQARWIGAVISTLVVVRGIGLCSACFFFVCKMQKKMVSFCGWCLLACLLYVVSCWINTLRPMTLETRFCQKELWVSKIPATVILYRSLWGQIFKKKVSNMKKKQKKTFPGQTLGQDRAETNSANVISKRRDSESLTDMGRENQRLRHEIWTGRAR